jgi:DNA repair protein RadC
MPSEEDIAVTEKVVEVGQIMDIPVFDHVIVSSSGWTSLRQQRLI